MSTLFDFSTMPQLRTERLTLRAVSPEHDLSAFYELFADPRVAEYTDTGPFASVDDAATVIAWITKIFADQQGMRWAITLSTDQDSLIGTCGFNRWSRQDNIAEIGYDLKYDHWGTGIMTEAVAELARFGFEHMDLNRIEADVTVGNTGSARVLQKLGFAEEGLLRQRGFWRGEYHDLRFFALLREDWQA